MYNRLYNHLIKNNIVYLKQFGFQKRHSTEHAVVQLIHHINSNFENNEFTTGVFINLSKTFDTVNHRILLKKLIHYGVLHEKQHFRKNAQPKYYIFLIFHN